MKRAIRILSTAALVSLVAALLVWYREPPSDEPMAEPVRNPPSAAMPAPSSEERAVEPEPARASEAALTTAAASAGSTTPAGDDRVEVCGHGTLDRDQADRVLDAELSTQPLQDALAARPAPTEREQALLHLLRIDAARMRAFESGTLSCDTGDTGCFARSTATRGATTVQHVGALVKLAQDTRDVQLLAGVMQTVCAQSSSAQYRGSGPSDPCSLLDARRWVELDPDNAAAWLAVATWAGMNDPTARTAALQRAAESPRLDRSLGFVQMALELPEMSGAPSLQGDRVLMVLGHLEFRRNIVAERFAVMAECIFHKPEGDAAREPLCSALAAMYLERDTSVDGLGVAAPLLERGYGPRERQAAVTEDLEALRRAQFLADTRDPGPQPASCDSLRAIRKAARLRASEGERATARRALVRSGLSRAELAAQYRQMTSAPFALPAPPAPGSPPAPPAPLAPVSPPAARASQ